MKKAVSLVISLLLIIGIVPISASSETISITQDGIEYVIDTATGEAEVGDADESIVTAEITSEINGYPVTSIGFSAFEDCTSLTSVTIPDSVTSISGSAFSGCTSLTSVTIPDSVTSISGSAFSGCTSLTSVTIGSSVTSMGRYAFEDCTSLTEIDVDENNQNYCSENGILFTKDKTELIQYPAGKSDISYTIPDSVTCIGDQAFRDCTSLTSVIIPDSVTSICYGAFYNTAYYNDETNWENGVLYLGNYLIKAKTDISGKYTIKDGTKLIADEAFSWCESLTSVTIPDSVTSIGDEAFRGCTSLTSVTIPDSVTSISYEAFSDCTSLTSVTIGGSVTSIGGGAFSDCTSLTFVTIPDSVTSIGGGVFYNTAYYNDETNWENGVLYIDNCLIAAQKTHDENYNKVVDLEVKGEYTIKDGTKVIAEEAFARCTSLTSVTIPGSVTSIGNGAFFWCESLASVTIPDSVTSISDYAFYWCTSLTSVTIPDSVTSISYEAFSDCTSLTSVTIPDSVTSTCNILREVNNQ